MDLLLQIFLVQHKSMHLQRLYSGGGGGGYLGCSPPATQGLGGPGGGGPSGASGVKVLELLEQLTQVVEAVELQTQVHIINTGRRLWRFRNSFNKIQVSK
jgi:hypothetical protein